MLIHKLMVIKSCLSDIRHAKLTSTRIIYRSRFSFSMIINTGKRGKVLCTGIREAVIGITKRS